MYIHCIPLHTCDFYATILGQADVHVCQNAYMLFRYCLKATVRITTGSQYQLKFEASYMNVSMSDSLNFS